MKSSDIRQKFLNFFQSQHHKIIPSSSLVPVNDSSILFTNSGMVQFKNVFTSKTEILNKRVTSIQKCLRAGGKHNDLENVGYTSRHHTFFEMLGNFSFGDYFKEDAIIYAWKILTEIFLIDPNKLYVTVYDEDDEAFHIWNKKIGLDNNRIIRIGDNKGGRYNSDNFWQMADTGPCGPCSEIFYDYGPEISGGLPGSTNSDGERYVEIWNLVFMQFEMDLNRELKKLPKPCIDTGMGLERISSVLQNVYSNYDIDTFKNLISSTAKIIGIESLKDNSLKVIADHIRSASFMISDGILPNNEGRGYVLRRIIRRALRHGYKLGKKSLFFYELVPSLVNEMGDFYHELKINADYIETILKQEELKFSKTLDHGMKLLNSELHNSVKNNILDGHIAFILYDTYGFPLDLTEDICKEQNISVDKNQFEISMKKQQNLARSHGKFYSDYIRYIGPKTIFDGYRNDELQNSKVIAIYTNGQKINDTYNINLSDILIIILDRTPFYAESGGQVGDKGVIYNENTKFSVLETKMIQSGVFAHFGSINKGLISVGDIVNAKIDLLNRKKISSNHSATHLLHKALCDIFKFDIEQKGSYIDSNKLRFDFSCSSSITENQISFIEDLVNKEIINNSLVTESIMPYKLAVKNGAKFLSLDKYEDNVRVINIGSSKELCGGTHVERTGDIGTFKIVSETGVSAGVRRIEALTGEKATHYINSQLKILKNITSLLNSTTENIIDNVIKLQKKLKDIEKDINKLNSMKLSDISNFLFIKGIMINDIYILVEFIQETINNKQLKSIIDNIKSYTKNKSLIFLVSLNDENNINYTAYVDQQLVNLINATDLIKIFSSKINGKGGGNKEIAMGNGNKIKDLKGILKNIQEFIYDHFRK